MSKVIYNKIIAKLERLDEYLRYLNEIKKISKKSFINDFHFYGLAERYLQLAIEATMDIGKLLILAQNFKKPEDNEDIFIVLCDNKVISQKLAHNFLGIGNFRNILVHDYEKINRIIVHEKLQKNLTDFKEFRKAVLKYLKKYL